METAQHYSILELYFLKCLRCERESAFAYFMPRDVPSSAMAWIPLWLKDSAMQSGHGKSRDPLVAVEQMDPIRVAAPPCGLPL